MIVLPFQYLLNLLKLEYSSRFPILYHKLILNLLNIKINTRGQLMDRPGLIVSNHGSWVDIFLLGSLGELSFIAKVEVSKWPFISLMAKLQKTIFVNRKRPNQLKSIIGEINKRLHNEKIVLFPEGTSSNGNLVLPFKSSLFGIYNTGKNIKNYNTIQPVSIAYTKLNGLPMDRASRPIIAWYGDMNLTSHLWGIIKSGPIDVEVTFHEPINFLETVSRKEIAFKCEAKVRSGMIDSLYERNIAQE
ncbi:MAG: 1-acyl-sn-glycerol-3-phosphate acyltransferase [Alphaproteobacteria bacterium]|jgi:1-acyl-sn-glycerol-3-phosphate acyltransferase